MLFRSDEIGIVASQLGQAIALYANLVTRETKQSENTQRDLLDSNVAVSAAFNNRFNSEIKKSGPPLSPRQIEILQSLIEGKTNYDIASELGYSVSTIRQETIKIYSMLNVSGRRAAAQEALRQQIV